MKQRKLIVDETEEERERAETEEALAKVAAFEAKEKEKEAELVNSWKSNIPPNKDAHIDSVLAPEVAQQIMAGQKIYKVLVNGKYPDYLVNGLVDANVYVQSTYIQPPLVSTIHCFENIFADINPRKDCMKRLGYTKCKSLREECSKGEPS
jgi:hypothetical protein